MTFNFNALIRFYLLRKLNCQISVIYYITEKFDFCYFYVCSLLNQKTLQYDKKSKSKKIVSKSNVCTISNERHQVKTYMDNSNGIRNPGSNSYNKVRCYLEFDLNISIASNINFLPYVQEIDNIFYTLLLFALILE